MRKLIAALGLFRLGNCLLITLAVFLPLAISSKDLIESLRRASPLFLIGMCTYILNDLDDIESDRVNHPERALPSGIIGESLAACLYFICLGIALLTIRFSLQPSETTLYYLLLVLVINYSYVVDYFPSWKSSYVAATVAIPMFIVVQYLPSGKQYYLIAAAAALFNLGREVCKDIIDIPGDKESVVHRIPPCQLSVFAFALQGIAAFVLVFVVDSPLKILALVAIVTLYLGSVVAWFRWEDQGRAVLLMKVVLFAGLIFLM